MERARMKAVHEIRNICERLIEAQLNGDPLDTTELQRIARMALNAVELEELK